MSIPVDSETEQLQLLWDIEQLLKCKVCQERITPPMVICRKGHCICKKCNSTGFMCVVCNKFLISDRFVMLENLLNTLPRYCKYFQYGCEKIVPGDSQHDKYCLQRPRTCELGKDTECHWTGSYYDWLEHAKDNPHVAVAYRNAVNNLMFVQYYGFPSKWEVYNMFLRFETSVFLLFSFKSEEFLHITVQYLGQDSIYSMQFPDYRLKITFLRDSIKSFSIELNSKDDKLAMCEDVPLDMLAPLVNPHQELDIYVELCMENQPHLLDLEEA